jgi:nucleotide-binding universal stress UspA family protein
MIWKRVMFSSAGLFGAPTHVVDRAGRIARGLNADLLLFDCFYDSDLLGAQPATAAVNTVIQQHIEQRRLELEVFADSFREQALKVHADVHWDYPPYEAIVRYALRHKPDLLVVPTTRARLSEQEFLSYTDHRLIEACPCPLLLLKRHEAYSNGAVVAAVDPMHVHAKPADLDETILGAANTLARALGDSAVHVCHFVPPSYQPGVQGPEGIAPQLAAERSAEVARLDSVAQRVRHMAALHDIPGSRVHVQFGRVREALPPLARGLRADVVVFSRRSIATCWSSNPGVFAVRSAAARPYPRRRRHRPSARAVGPFLKALFQHPSGANVITMVNGVMVLVSRLLGEFLRGDKCPRTLCSALKPRVVPYQSL